MPLRRREIGWFGKACDGVALVPGQLRPEWFQEVASLADPKVAETEGVPPTCPAIR